jgi:hypothetical protein
MDISIFYRSGHVFKYLYVHGSIHLGNVYVQLKIQLDALVVFFIPLYFLALHVSGAIAKPERGKSARLSQPVPTPMD